MFFLRDRRYNANDYINEINGRAKSPYHFDQYGASVGGPIVQDRHFFFVNSVSAGPRIMQLAAKLIF